jgi:hypothetical protein
MPHLWGRQFTRAELMARVGDVSQIGGVREYRLDGGPGDGLPVVDVNTGSGLRFTVVPGRALDITGAWFNDIPLGFRAPAGEMHGAYHEPDGWGWVRSTVLGLLVTGGLDNVGDPAVEADRLFSDFGLHGRLSNLAASNVHADGEWQGDDYEMWVQGRVRQAALFGENLELKRRISTSLGATSIRIHDEVTNLGAEPEPAMILFHVNPGYPLLDDGARLHVRSRSRRPYDDHSASLESDWNTYGPPTPGWQNTVWIHDVESNDEGLVHAALVNRSLGDGIGLGFTYPKAQLPFLNQWKFLGVGNYVTGIEPANCTVLGRAVNQADGTLQVLEPGETTEFDLELSVLAGSDAIGAFLANIGE